MTPQQVFLMLCRKSVTLASGIIIGAWFAMQYPDMTKKIFQAPLAGLVMVLVSFWMSYKNESKNGNGGVVIQPDKPVDGTGVKPV